MEECSEIDDAEINDDESFEDSYDEYDISQINQLVELNTTGIVMSDDEYSCGAASFATVANNLGMNISLDEAKTAVNTTTDGTTMAGIINGAKNYNLTAYGVSVNMNYLNENFIVHMTINDTDHWSVVKQISDDYIILADPNLGIVNYTKECFAELYTNNSIIISKSFVDINKLEEENVIILSVEKTKRISGKKAKYKYVPKKAYKKYRYHVNKGKWQYRWVYPTDVYKYSCLKLLRGTIVYYYWSWVDIKYKYSKWHNC